MISPVENDSEKKAFLSGSLLIWPGSKNLAAFTEREPVVCPVRYISQDYATVSQSSKSWWKPLITVKTTTFSFLILLKEIEGTVARPKVSAPKQRILLFLPGIANIEIQGELVHKSVRKS